MKILLALWDRVRLAEDEEQLRVLKLSHRQMQRQLQRFRRQARGRFVQNICKEAEESMHSHDTGKFYRTLKRLGIHLSEHSNEGKVEHGLKELREHCQKVSGTVKHVKEEVLHDVPGRQVEQWLGDTPSSQEIRMATSKVRDCASGWDEVTAGMLRWSGPTARQCVVSLVQYLWNAPPSQWERSIKTGIGVRMYKHKGDRQDLGNYRIIMLLSVISRVVARVVATRLQKWAEQAGFLHDLQYGFRPSRRCTDPALIFILLLDMANSAKPEDDTEEDPLVFVLRDIVKAYPSVQRHLAWRLFHRLGVPDKMLRVLSPLHDGTLYRIRSGREYIDEFNMAVGFREGCPSSPVCFSIFRNFAICGFLRLRQKHGDEGLCLAVKPGGPVNTRKALSKKPEHDEVMRLLAVLFADDATGLTRLSHLDAFEADMQNALELYKEQLHPGKTHRLHAGHRPGPRSKFDDAVRFLGVWLQWDGGHDRNTHERLAAASRVWGQLSRQLPRLGLTVWKKGPVVNATVVNCLLFGCERRTYTGKQLDLQVSDLSQPYHFLNLWTAKACNVRRPAHASRSAEEMWYFAYQTCHRNTSAAVPRSSCSPTPATTGKAGIVDVELSVA